MSNNFSKKTPSEKEIEEVLATIEGFMANQGGHLSVAVEKDGTITKDTITIDSSCGCVQGACQAPTLMEGLDNEEERNSYGKDKSTTD